jgi:hypothetical protein
MKEQTLSDKIKFMPTINENILFREDVREFIQKLKDEIWNCGGQWSKIKPLKIIDKLVGKELC